MSNTKYVMSYYRLLSQLKAVNHTISVLHDMIYEDAHISAISVSDMEGLKKSLHAMMILRQETCDNLYVLSQVLDTTVHNI